MFPKGVLIAGGGGGGGTSGGHAGSHPTTHPDPIGGFNGVSRSSSLGSGSIGEGGLVGGKGGRIWSTNEPGDGLVPGSGPAPRGTGGNGQYPEGYAPSYQGGGGGGAGGAARPRRAHGGRAAQLAAYRLRFPPFRGS